MSKIENPPAFPKRMGYGLDAGGMTLRDWFAGQALAGMGTWSPEGTAGFNGSAYHRERQRLRAQWAYQQADTMLAERERS